MPTSKKQSDSKLEKLDRKLSCLYKPAAIKTQEQNKELSKEISEHNKKTKEEKKKVTKRRMTTRNQKKVE